MKGIAGTGSLALPLAFANVRFHFLLCVCNNNNMQVGIIPGLLLFVLVCGMMILATYQLIQLNHEINEVNPVGIEPTHTLRIGQLQGH